MKKLISMLIVLVLAIGMINIPVMAASDVSVYLFGEKLEFDVPPQIIGGRTLVPMRKIFESLGYIVNWDKNTKTAIAIREGMTIRITENSYTMYVNGEEKTLDVAPCIVKGRTMVPARAISESSGYNVDWDKDTRSVIITEKNPLDKKIVGKLGDYDITQSFYNACYYVTYSQYAQYEQYYGENWMDAPAGNGSTIGQMIDYDTENQVKQLAMVLVLAEKIYGITMADVQNSIDEYLKETEDSYGGKEGFETFLSGANMTKDGLATYFASYDMLDILLENELIHHKIVTASDKDIEAMFNQEYAGKVKVQHILISTTSLDGYTPARTDQEAKAIVYEVLAKLKKGEDFGKLIEQYNEDPGQSAGSYYTFGDGEMVKEFETASKKLAVGKYTTQAVKSDYGYHIIKRYPIDKTGEDFEYYRLEFVQNSLVNAIIEEAAKTPLEWNK